MDRREKKIKRHCEKFWYIILKSENGKALTRWSYVSKIVDGVGYI